MGLRRALTTLSRLSSFRVVSAALCRVASLPWRYPVKKATWFVDYMGYCYHSKESPMHAPNMQVTVWGPTQLPEVNLKGEAVRIGAMLCGGRYGKPKEAVSLTGFGEIPVLNVHPKAYSDVLGVLAQRALPMYGQ